MNRIHVVMVCTIFAAAIVFTPVTIAQSGDDLITAVTYQDLSKVRELVEAGADVNYKEKAYGNTPLAMACQYDLVDIAQYLIDNGADINLPTNTGHTPLMAAATGSEELLTLLLDMGADPLKKLENGTSAFTMLVTGILMGRISLEAADKLIEAGADVDETAHMGATEGYTCLMMAARNQRPDLVKYLAEHGADVNATAADGNTPLSLAIKEGDEQMQALLKELGAR